MASTPTLSQGATQAQAIAYLNAFWGSAKYQNSTSTPYNGKTAAQIYSQLQKEHPTGYTPYQYAQAASDLMLSSGIGSGISQGTSEGLTTINDSAVAASNEANYPSLPSWTQGLASLLGDLTDKNLWTRVAKLLIGATLVIVGVAKMSGASNVITKTVDKVPVLPL